MIIRIVKMNFRNGEEEKFLSLFAEVKTQIRNFPGCSHLELWRDANNPQTFFTYSIWGDESALNHYRFSDLFKTTWAKTKILFAEKAAAWSLSQTLL